MNNSILDSKNPLDTTDLNRPRKPGRVARKDQNRRQRLCKNHPERDATKICLSAGCTLAREICDECAKQPPHFTHQSLVLDTRKFFRETEYGLANFQLNSPQSVAMKQLEKGRLFFLKYFQSMTNILLEKSPVYSKVLGLIEQSEGIGDNMGTYELERYIGELMSICDVNRAGKFEPVPDSLGAFQDPALQQALNNAFEMLGEIENAMIDFHDNFASVLEFQGQSNSRFNNENLKKRMQALRGNTNGSFQVKCENTQMGSNNNNSNLGSSFIVNNTSNMQNSSMDPSQIQNQEEYDCSQGDNIYNTNSNNNITDNNNNMTACSFLDSELFPNETANLSMLNQSEFPSNPIARKQFTRPKGSKLTGRFRSKFTDEQRIQILQEVDLMKNVQIVADRHNIQNSLIRYWARQYNYQFDQQTAAARRPYRTFTRDQKIQIISEAIMKRDIMLVAEEHNMNAMMLKKWIQKSGQGGDLPQFEMKKLMNAVTNKSEESDQESENDNDNDDEEEEGDNDDQEQEIYQDNEGQQLEKNQEIRNETTNEQENSPENAERLEEEQSLQKQSQKKPIKIRFMKRIDEKYSPSNRRNQQFEDILGQRTKKKVKRPAQFSEQKPNQVEFKQESIFEPEEEEQEEEEKHDAFQNFFSKVQVKDMKQSDTAVVVEPVVDIQELDLTQDTNLQKKNLQRMREQLLSEIQNLKQTQQGGQRHNNSLSPGNDSTQ